MSWSLSTIPPEVPGLMGQFTDEYVLGYERRVFGQFKAGIRGIYRALGAAIEDAYVENLGEFLWGNPGYGDLSSVPRARREYSALVLTFDKPIGDGYSFSFAYALSRNYGNYPGLYNPDNEQINPNASTIFDFPDMYPNSTGLLPNDVTHMLTLSGSYAFTFGLTGGAAFLSWTDSSTTESGFHLERQVSVVGTWSALAEAGPNVVSYADTNVVAGGRYDYQLRAWNAAGSSVFSAPATGTAPGSPARPSIAVVSNAPISFQFGTTPGRTSVVEYAQSLPAPQWTLLQSVLGDGTPASVTDTNPPAGQRYYRVRVP